jgi:multiple RNA-binding domain-containing protein 1
MINPAVKLALAETHIIEETRKFLATQGVHLGAFSSQSSGERQRRSPTTLLIKNIPFGTSDTVLRDMFAAHGEIVRLVIPPSGTIAVIDYDDPSSADSAVRHLSYKRVGNSVMYIERAPEAVWEATDEDRQIAGNTSAGPKPITISETHAEVDTAAGSTLYVKNLSFSTISESLVRAFQHLPNFSFARVSMKPDPKNPGGKLSMGFGFVGFSTVDAAKRAQASMDGYVLDGHKLVIKFAGRGAEDGGESKAAVVGKRQTTKMLVKNLPFEATKKDVRQLFGYVFSFRRYEYGLTLLQYSWSTEVCSRSQTVRLEIAWICLPRFR